MDSALEYLLWLLWALVANDKIFEIEVADRQTERLTDRKIDSQSAYLLGICTDIAVGKSAMQMPAQS